MAVNEEISYFVHYNVWLNQQLVEAVQIGCSDPMQGLTDVAALFKRTQGFGSYGTLECFRYVNGEKKERQWGLTID